MRIDLERISVITLKILKSLHCLFHLLKNNNSILQFLLYFNFFLVEFHGQVVHIIL